MQSISNGGSAKHPEKALHARHAAPVSAVTRSAAGPEPLPPAVGSAAEGGGVGSRPRSHRFALGSSPWSPSVGSLPA